MAPLLAGLRSTSALFSASTPSRQRGRWCARSFWCEPSNCEDDGPPLLRHSFGIQRLCHVSVLAKPACRAVWLLTCLAPSGRSGLPCLRTPQGPRRALTHCSWDRSLVFLFRASALHLTVAPCVCLWRCQCPVACRPVKWQGRAISDRLAPAVWPPLLLVGPGLTQYVFPCC